MRTIAILFLSVILSPRLSTAATPPIRDPQAFVTDVYRLLIENQDRKPGRPEYDPPGDDADIYTPRLKALFSEDLRRSGGEVGCIDFVYWVNGQDWMLKNVRVTSRDIAGRPDRKEVIATFLNLGDPQELHFDFQRISGFWLLDEVRSLKSTRFTLSNTLRCWDRLPR